MSVEMILIGGSGRSGTSFVANCIGGHPDVVTFKDVELKIFSEFGGLSDLQLNLIDAFSPNRAEMALRSFERVFEGVCNGNYGQPALRELVEYDKLYSLKEDFFNKIMPDGRIVQLDSATFNVYMRDFIKGLTEFAFDIKPTATKFLEKTPHILLQPRFVSQISRTIKCIHICREPKAVAVSLLNQSWGPDKLDAAVSWVKSYFSAWFTAREYYITFDLPLLELRIEDVARNPDDVGRYVCGYLDIEVMPDIFSGVSMDNLNKWINNVSRSEMDYLIEKLDGLSGELGY